MATINHACVFACMVRSVTVVSKYPTQKAKKKQEANIYLILFVTIAWTGWGYHLRRPGS